MEEKFHPQNSWPEMINLFFLNRILRMNIDVRMGNNQHNFYVTLLRQFFFQIKSTLKAFW